MSKWVYGFGAGRAEGRADMKDLLGGKGANLAEMSALGLPIPPGFTIATTVCTSYYANGRAYPAGLRESVHKALTVLETLLSAKLGDPKSPLLVSVRSGSRASMPGMMDTILNLGLNDVSVEGLATTAGDRRFAYDSYRRFIQMYAHVVLGVDHRHFETILEDHKHERSLSLDTELTAEDWSIVIEHYKAKIQEEQDRPFPQDIHEQLWGAIGAVLESWMNNRAIEFRRYNDIPEIWGTAVTIQAMVFGNMGDDCCTGVCFTRDPSTGESTFFGEFLPNAQGEDVVAGLRTPRQLTKAARLVQNSDLPAMEEAMPAAFKALNAIRHKLEAHYKDMQDVEFTVERNRLWILQTRTGVRSTKAALRIAVDMAREGLITRKEAIGRIDPGTLDHLLHPAIDPTAPREILGRGLPASPGAASGRVVFSAEDAEYWVKQKKEKVILVRPETSPEDISGMHVSEGILTTRGGRTSHAAVVARGMGMPSVVGAGSVRIDMAARRMRVGGKIVKEGDIITIDGASGEFFLGEVPTVQPEMTGDFATLMEWVDTIRTLKVRANAETPEEAATARRFGAEGIGLCRTEHMFFDSDRILSVREMILAIDEKGRRAVLAKLLPYQRQDFVALFLIMQGLPVTIRLLDPPLHEFLPREEAELAELARAMKIDVETVRTRAAALYESNPMLGHRGCRLGITYPEIYETQVRAIFEAAIEVSRSTGKTVTPEIMVPLVGTKKELDILKAVIDAEAALVFAETGHSLPYMVGTMIELPRAALRAGEIAEVAEFFSFGTNDLTQTTFGLSRDDCGWLLDIYREKGIYEHDPFAQLDQAGVGELVQIGSERGRAVRPGLKLGICGEHGGDPASIAFCQKVGLDYVSCSPYRVPIARLAAAQAALQ